MAEPKENGNGASSGSETPQAGAAAPAAQAARASMSIVNQYVKDLSFENPDAPNSFRPQNPPKITINVNVETSLLQAADHEVELKMEARALDGDKTLFAIELVYAGIFRIANVPPEQVRPVLLTEGPRLLFPFARQILADASRNGGFPPVMIDPVDFLSLYRQRLAAQAAQGNQGQRLV